MRKWLFQAMLAGLFLVSLPPSRAADDDVKVLIEKSIKAHGGEANLVRMQMGQAKSKGTMQIMGVSVPFTSDLLYQFPTKMKNVLTLKVGGEKLTMVQVLNGKRAWVTTAGETKDLDADELKAVQEEAFSNQVETLVPLLKDNAFTLSAIGAAQVNGKAAAGVKVQAKDHNDIELYFDKETDLLVRVVRNAYDGETMKEATFETIYSDFKDYSGVKQGAKSRVNKNGKKFAEVDLLEWKLLDKVEPKEFNKST